MCTRLISWTVLARTSNSLAAPSSPFSPSGLTLASHICSPSGFITNASNCAAGILPSRHFSSADMSLRTSACGWWCTTRSRMTVTDPPRECCKYKHMEYARGRNTPRAMRPPQIGHLYPQALSSGQHLAAYRNTVLAIPTIPRPSALSASANHISSWPASWPSRVLAHQRPALCRTGDRSPPSATAATLAAHRGS